MKKSYRNSLRLLAGTLFAALLFTGLFSCVDVDNTFGEEYIPHDQHAKVVQDRSFVIRTYNVTSPDSLTAGGKTLNIIGSCKEENTGASVHAGLLFQMTSAGFPSNKQDSMYGIEPVIDSAFLKFSITDRVGNTEKEQMFDLYELTERIWYDSTYYYNFDAGEISKPDPLFSFTHSGDENLINYRIEDPDFLDRLLDTTGYWRDSLFKERFKGFYLKPRIAHDAAALYEVYLDNSFIQVYYHNKNPKPDTASVYYGFNLTDGYYGYVTNHCVNVIDRDYSGVYPEIGLDDPEMPVSKTFVQSYGGILTKLEFTEESVEEIKKKVKEAGYSKIAVNKARLEVPYPARTPELLDQLHTRFGMYQDYRENVPITDFNYSTEAYMRLVQQSNSYILPYGGLLNRSLFRYEMDITGYVQNLFKEGYDKREIILGPTYEDDGRDAQTSFYNLHTSVLEGFGSETPLNLVITYTMLR